MAKGGRRQAGGGRVHGRSAAQARHSTRVSRSASGSKSAETRASPSERSRIRRRRPRSTFLSRAISSSILSGVNSRGILVGRARRRNRERIRSNSAFENPAQAPGKERRRADSCGHRFSMPPASVAEDRPSMACPKVCPRFSSARVPPSLSSCATISALISQQRRTARASVSPSFASSASACFSSHVKKAGSTIRAYLTTSARPARSSPVGQGLQRGHVGDHADRLMKHADHVLSEGVVYGRLASDGGVDLSEEGGGHLDEGDPTLIAAGHEARDVAHHPAAERDHHAVPRETRAQEAGP